MAALMRALLARPLETQDDGTGNPKSNLHPLLSWASPQLNEGWKEWRPFTARRSDKVHGARFEVELGKLKFATSFKVSSFNLDQVFAPAVAYAAGDEASSSAERKSEEGEGGGGVVVKKNRGWERPDVPPVKPAPPRPKSHLSLDANIVIEASKGSLEVTHPKLKALLDAHHLVVSQRVVPEIKDETSRSFLANNCFIQPLCPEATNAAVGYSKSLVTGAPNVDNTEAFTFTGNEHLDLACYLDACHRGLPHVTMDKRFLEQILLAPNAFQSFMNKCDLNLSKLHVSIKGQRKLGDSFTDKEAERKFQSWPILDHIYNRFTQK